MHSGRKAWRRGYLIIFTGSVPEYRDEEATGYLARIYLNALLSLVLPSINLALDLSHSGDQFHIRSVGA